jgi:hypothetical protein
MVVPVHPEAEQLLLKQLSQLLQLEQLHNQHVLQPEVWH